MAFPGIRPARLLTAAAAVAGSVALASPASAAVAAPLPATTTFFAPAPDSGATLQISQLTQARDSKDAALVHKEARTPHAVWVTGGTPAKARTTVHGVVLKAAAAGTVPVLVMYDVPGRDCGRYSAGGAATDTAYRTWVTAFAAGLVAGQKVVVVVEPDGLASLPSDCPAAYPGQDVAALSAARIADIKAAGLAVQKADPSALVYLDAGNSAWLGVGTATSRLVQAGVRQFAGFALGVASYQWTADLEAYGTWISDCLAYTNTIAPSGYADCGDQFWTGGPANGWTSTPLDPDLQWSDTATAAAARTAGITSRYAAELGTTRPTARFVVDTSRNGLGPWDPRTTPGTAYPDAQTWCNAPGRGLGAVPQGAPAAAVPLLDAFLWIKTPGESDGPCTRGIAGGGTDPAWGGTADPAAGAWFPAQALQLAQPAG